MPCPFTGPKMFWAGSKFLCQTKNLCTYCGSHKHSFCARQKDDLHSVTLVFVPALKFLKNQIFGLAQNIWTRTKHFETCKRTRHMFINTI